MPSILGITASGAADVVVPPDPPDGDPVGLSATGGDGEIVLGWTNTATNATEYHVERSPDAPGTWAPLVDGLAGNAEAYTDSGLGDGETYYYRVYCSNADGNSAYSNEAGDSTTQPAPVKAIDVIDFSMSTGGGVQNVTIPGFGEVKGALFEWTNNPVNGYLNAGAVRGFGVFDGTNHACGAVGTAHNASGSDTQSYQNTDCCIVVWDLVTRSIVAKATCAFITNGISLTWTVTPDQAYRCSVTLFGGTGIEVLAGAVDTLGTVSGMASQPDIVIGSCVDQANSTSVYGGGGNQNGGRITWGAATATVQWCNSYEDDDGRTSVSIYSGTFEVFLRNHRNGLTAPNDDQFITLTMQADGFSLSSPQTSRGPLNYIAIAGINAYIGTHVMPTSPGQQAYTGFGFQPLIVRGQSTDLGTPPAFAGNGLGGIVDTSWATENIQTLVGHGSEDNVSTTNTHVHFFENFIHTRNHQGTLLSNANLLSLDANGCTLDYTLAGGAYGFILMGLG